MSACVLSLVPKQDRESHIGSMAGVSVAASIARGVVGLNLLRARSGGEISGDRNEPVPRAKYV